MIGVDFKREFAKTIRQYIGGLRLLRGIEERFLKSSKKKKNPPLFIIGSPRTGSTFLVQLLTTYYEFGFIPNLSSIFYNSPVLITRLIYPFFDKNKDFIENSNRHGVINDIFASSEAAEVFEKWFGGEELSQEHRRFVRDSVFSLQALFNSPLLMKNMNNSLRVERISKIFPEALFIFLKRDELYTAQSILKTRKDLEGSYEAWWSTKPNEYNELKGLEPEEQVLYQVKYIENHIKNSHEEDIINNLIKINYESLCKNPEKQLEKITDWYKEKGVEIKKMNKGQGQIPRFEPSKSRKIPDQKWEKLIACHEQIFG